MTFNRYVAMRMAIELLGAVCCAATIIGGDSLAGVIVTACVALVWVIGEACVLALVRRSEPRTDELSDEHQDSAFRTAFLVLVAVMVVLGFGGLVARLAGAPLPALDPMLLPTLAMLALAGADARYLWLERSHDGGDDED